jgi:PKD repeat protein
MVDTGCITGLAIQELTRLKLEVKMENNTNFKVNTTSITAILVFLALALLAASSSSVAAQLVTVDGDESDWVGLTGVKCMVDDTGEIGTDQTPYFVNGYDIAKFCVYYDQSNDTLYFKINTNTTGVPGDTDGDGNPNDTSDPSKPDNHEVGYGETYAARLDLDGDCNIDYKLEYSNNNVAMKDYTTGDVVAGTAVGSIGSTPYTDTVVEMSFSPAHNIPGFGDCNTDFKSQGWAGNEHDGLGEDNTSKFSVNKAPVPIPVGDHVCYCTNTTFDGSGSYDPDGTIAMYEWDFDGDGNTDDTGVTVSHHFGAVGAHTVTLTVTDDYGFKCSNTTTVWVYGNPTANFTVTEVDFGTATEFTNTTTGGTPPYTYRWDFDNDGTYELEGNYPNPTYLYPASGDYTACMSITDSHGCTDDVCKPVHVKNLPPVAEFDWGGTGCKIGILNASESYDPDGSIMDYDWDLDDDGDYDDATGVTCTFGPVLAGAYWIGLKVTDSSSLTNTTRKQITVTGNPHAVAEANGHTGSIQLPEGGGWVVFSGINSTAYPGTVIVNVSCIWDILGNGIYSGLGPLSPIFIDRDATATLTVVANNTCTDVSRVRVLMPPTVEDVPILTPAGMIALIGMLCIVGVGRIARKGRGS